MEKTQSNYRSKLYFHQSLMYACVEYYDQITILVSVAWANFLLSI